MKKITLFVPYYLSEDYSRQVEIDLCLNKNIAIDEIDKIFLLIDDGTVPSVSHLKVNIINIHNRPTYKDWIDLTMEHAKDSISVLANSDIYFDNSIVYLREILENQKTFVAISRYDIDDGIQVLHKNPQWSQDVWCIDGEISGHIDAKKYLNISLGVPRCDNKVAYIFSINGYNIVNPCKFIKTFHMHKSQIRSYNPYIDKRILGGVAYVYPSETLVEKSKLAYDVWTMGLHNIEQIKINKTLVKKEADGVGIKYDMKDAALIVAYNRNWQFPAITEQYAYEMLNKQLRSLDLTNSDVVYFAFPWATLIDNMLWNKKNKEKTDFLKMKLDSYKTKLNKKYIITVCQHIRLMEFQFLFKEIGITDIFWSHTTKSSDALPEYPEINLHPFPLYPVQADNISLEYNQKREYLYSFVGAKSTQKYLTNSRNIIIDELSKTNTGLIIGNDNWHFNKIVYDYQINENVKQSEGLVDTDSGENFKKILSQSIFSLCPSGTGPNSIRLWESIGFGSIPVIISDNLELPGDIKLWHQAAIFCKEDRDSILSLPKILLSVCANNELMEQKRQAMSEIWNLYGINNFVYDIKRLIMEKINSLNAINSVFRGINRNDDNRMANYEIEDESVNITTITTEIILQPEKFCNRIKNERQKIETQLKNVSCNQRLLFERALELRNLKSIWDTK
jgi:hypothetical protein